MAGVEWIRIMTDMFDNRKIKYIRTLPEGNNIVLIWVMLLTMAGRCNAGGMIFLTENIPYNTKMLSDELGFEENVVTLAIATLERLNMIIADSGFLCIAGWEEHQNADGLEKIREQTRKRVHNYRNKKKEIPCNNSENTEKNEDVTECNVTERYNVTLRNATEEEKEIDKDIKKESKERKISPARSDDTDFEKLWDFTFSVYPKKSGAATAKEEWMKKLVPVLPENRFDVAKLIYEGVKEYLSDYSQKNRDDPDYKYIPKFARWLSEDAVYWIKFVEEKQRSDSS